MLAFSVFNFQFSFVFLSSLSHSDAAPPSYLSPPCWGKSVTSSLEEPLMYGKVPDDCLVTFTGRKADGSHLPDCFKLQLTEFLPKQPLLNAMGKAGQKEAKGKGQGKVDTEGEVKGRGAKGRAGGVGRKHPSDEHK